MHDALILILGPATVIVGTLVKVIGFPDQFRKTYKRKTTHGLSTVFYALALLSYVLWTLYGWVRHDNVLILGQGIGILTTAPIVYQIWLYRKNKEEK